MLNFWPAVCMVSLCSVCNLLVFRLLLLARSRAARQRSRAARSGACAVSEPAHVSSSCPAAKRRVQRGWRQQGHAAAGVSLPSTDAYTNAYGEAGVDMRPTVPVSNLGGVIKLALPTLALSETASSLVPRLLSGPKRHLAVVAAGRCSGRSHAVAVAIGGADCLCAREC